MNDLYVKALKIEGRTDTGEETPYYASLPAVQGLQKMGGLALKSPVTFFVGENGSGKSTLLEAIAVAAGLNAEGGSRNFNFSTADTHSGLAGDMTLVRSVRRQSDSFFLRAESFYNVASEVERLEQIGLPGFYDSFGGASLHRQSHGESFLSLVLNRLRGNGLYLFDEPEAALSPANQLALLARIQQLVEDNSQFIIATHAPILMAYPGADIVVLHEGGLTVTPFEEVEHVRLTKQFLSNPQGILRRLLAREEDEL